MLDLTSVQLASRVEDLAFSPAGDLAIASGTCVWLATAAGATARLAAGSSDDDIVECVAFRDARTLAIACKETGLRIVELGGKPRVTHIASECYWSSMVWSPDGKYIVGGQYEPFVTVIDVEERRELRVLDPDEFDDEGRTAVRFEGATLFTTAYNKLVRWRWADVLAGKDRCRMPKTGVSGHAHLTDLASLADGSLVAIGNVDANDYFVQRFAPTGERIGKRHALEASAIRIVTTGEQLVVLPSDAPPRLCEVDGTLQRELPCDVGDNRVLAVSPDGATLVVGGSRGITALALR